MVRTLLPIALVVGVGFAPVCARAQSQLSLKSVSVDLPPGDDMFPNGPGADAINNNCLACHRPKDVGAIVDYLVSIKGVK
jgi:hypothetical protein